VKAADLVKSSGGGGSSSSSSSSSMLYLCLYCKVGGLLNVDLSLHTVEWCGRPRIWFPKRGQISEQKFIERQFLSLQKFDFCRCFEFANVLPEMHRLLPMSVML
jgi:hypothetical protein